MKEPQFFTLNDGRGSMRLVPCFRPEEWDEFKIGKDENVPKGKLCFIASGGKKFWDVISTSGVLYVFSEKVVNMLQNNNITGCKFYPITIKEHEDLKYYLLTITGKCGSLDDSKAELIETLSGPATKIQNTNITIPKQHFSVMMITFKTVANIDIIPFTRRGILCMSFGTCTSSCISLSPIEA